MRKIAIIFAVFSLVACSDATSPQKEFQKKASKQLLNSDPDASVETPALGWPGTVDFPVGTAPDPKHCPPTTIGLPTHLIYYLAYEDYREINLGLWERGWYVGTYIREDFQRKFVIDCGDGELMYNGPT